MVIIRRAGDRGQADHGWLLSYHTFSFAEYYDPRYVAYGALRVINEDRVAPGQGFGTHGHRDMEILTYVLAGALEHRDSMGNGSVIRRGDVQRMSAGTGVRHSEFNASREEPVHFLQIWIEPAQRGDPPGYQQKFFGDDVKRGRLRPVATPDGRDGSLTIHQDARLHAAIVDGEDRLVHRLAAGRRAYVHVALGSVEVNAQHLTAGDGAMIDDAEIRFERGQGGEILLFDLA